MRYLTLFFLIMIGCNQTGHHNRKHFLINAKVKNIEDSTKVIVYDIRAKKPLDSTYAINGVFSLKGEIKYSVPGILFFEGKKRYSGINIWLDDAETVKIKTDIKKYKKSRSITLDKKDIQKSKLNRIFSEYEKERELIYNSYSKELLKTKGDKIKRKKILKKCVALAKKKDLEKAFNSPNNYIALSCISKYRFSIPKDSLFDYYKKLDVNIKKSEEGLSLKNFIETKTLNVGDFMSDFTVRDINNNPFCLSDYSKRVILLTFWSSTCAPCRKENKDDLPQIIKKYKEKKLTLISFSLDRKKQNWKRASKEDNISWLNISDLKGNNSQISMKYGVERLPTFFIINKKGLITHKIEGNIKLLKEELERFFNEKK